MDSQNVAHRGELFRSLCKGSLELGADMVLCCVSHEVPKGHITKSKKALLDFASRVAWDLGYEPTAAAIITRRALERYQTALDETLEALKANA